MKIRVMRQKKRKTNTKKPIGNEGEKLKRQTERDKAERHR